jgi:pimeloyl-ACP methyl ester carboxylesterase
MQVLLVHGMGRSPLSMAPLALGLRADGMRPRFFGYLSAVESVDRMVSRLVQRLVAISAEPYVVVGHSLGGVLLRLAIDRLPVSARLPEHLVLVGSPQGAARLAQQFASWVPYRLMYGEAGQMLADPARMAAISPPSVPCSVVVGTRGFPAVVSPFGPALNDGIVAVTEVVPDGEAETVLLPRGHTFLMNAREVREIIRRHVGGTA